MNTDILISIIVAVFASTGFWTVINTIVARKSAKNDKKDALTQMIIGLGHDRIYDLCEKYIARGYITTSEYDNLKYLYEPYVALGGNGTGTKLKDAVDKLPVKTSHEI